MEAINFPNQFNIRGIIILIHPVPLFESINRAFWKFNFRNGSGLLQFWACTPSSSEDGGLELMLTDLTSWSIQDEGLEDYRRRCLENHYPSVGIETRVGNWLPGRAAQTRIAEQRTVHHVLNHEDQHSADVGGRGQLVLPVFSRQGVVAKLVGIIELVTTVPRESYIDDFEQIHTLLRNEGLISNYIGKMIKVIKDNDIIRFPLPLSVEFTDLHREVIERFKELEHQNFRVEYNDREGNRLPISSDEDLQDCMAESSSTGGMLIRMYVLLDA